MNQHYNRHHNRVSPRLILDAIESLGSEFPPDDTVVEIRIHPDNEADFRRLCEIPPKEGDPAFRQVALSINGYYAATPIPVLTSRLTPRDYWLGCNHCGKLIKVGLIPGTETQRRLEDQPGKLQCPEDESTS